MAQQMKISIESELLGLILDYGRKCQDYAFYGEQDSVRAEKRMREAKDYMDDLFGRIKRKVTALETQIVSYSEN